jgi:hypothetical protein
VPPPAGNPFDQFDEQPVAVPKPAAAPVGNDFDKFDAPPPQREKVSQFEQLKRDIRPLGLAGRAVVEGGMDLVSPFADALSYGVNKALPGDPLPYRHSEAFSQALTDKGVPAPASGPERFSNVASRMITGMAAGGPINRAITGGLGLVTPASAVRAPPPSQQVLAAAQKEGMVVPPAQAAPRSLGALFEGMGGTLKTGQQAAARNQPVINNLAARAVGVPDEALSPELLKSIRDQAGNAYRVIRGAGTVTTDAQFVQQVTNAAKPFRSAAQSFASLTNKELTGIADDIAKQSFEADAAVDAIQMLRDKASSAFRNGLSSEGNAYKSMAGALEGAIERHLAGQGGVGAQALDAFRAARTLIAKTYTVEDALKGSNVDINALGRMLKNGVPMTDELKMLGQFAQHFPGAANLTSALKARPSYSPLDAVTTLGSLGGAAVTGQFASPGAVAAVAAPAVYAAARPLFRGAALSGPMQRGLLAKGPAIPWRQGFFAAPAAVNEAKK